MAQRIREPSGRCARARFDQPYGCHAAVLRVLYPIFNEGYTGEVDLAVEGDPADPASSAAGKDDPEIAGLLALMLLHHARRAARLTPDGEIVPLAEQDRSRWGHRDDHRGVGIPQRTLARDRFGEYQAQAAIAALHDDARTSAKPTGPRSRPGTTSCWFLRRNGGPAQPGRRDRRDRRTAVRSEGTRGRRSRYPAS